MTARFLAGGETFQAPAVDEKYVKPAIVIVIVEREATASGFKQIFILAFAPVGSFDGQARLLDDIDEIDAEGSSFDGRFRTFGRRHWLRIIASFDGSRELDLLSDC
jgi:hypothetical protein